MVGTQRAAAAVVEFLEARAMLSAVPLTVIQATGWDGTQLRINGTPGNDQITVKQTAGALLVGNTGGWTTTVAGTFVNIVIDGGGGNDSVVVDPSVTTDCILYGGVGNDTLVGGSGNDTLYGGAGKNRLYGGAGDDVLDTLGSTRDTLVGGSGQDSFWTDANASLERVTDLTSQELAAGGVHRVASFYAPPGTPKARQRVSAVTSVRAFAEPGTDGQGAYVDDSNHPLFSSAGPSQDDVIQGNVGDCYFLASLAATAKIDPARIRQSILNLGDGSYLVQFSRGSAKFFVHVDGELPTVDGSPEYAGFGADGSIWAPVMEKAFAVFRTGAASYLSLNGGWMDEAFTALGATSASVYDAADGTTLLSDMQRELAAGKAVAFGTATVTDGAPLLSSHAYTVESVNTDANGTPVSVVMRNPWGVDGVGNDGSDDGYVTVTAAQAYNDFLGFSTATV